MRNSERLRGSQRLSSPLEVNVTRTLSDSDLSSLSDSLETAFMSLISEMGASFMGSDQTYKRNFMVYFICLVVLFTIEKISITK